MCLKQHQNRRVIKLKLFLCGKIQTNKAVFEDKIIAELCLLPVFNGSVHTPYSGSFCFLRIEKSRIKKS